MTYQSYKNLSQTLFLKNFAAHNRRHCIADKPLFYAQAKNSFVGYCCQPRVTFAPKDNFFVNLLIHVFVLMNKNINWFRFYKNL